MHSQRAFGTVSTESAAGVETSARVEPSVPPHLLPSLKRYKELQRLQAYFDGDQYKGLPDFFTGRKGNGEVVPLRERAPCITYGLAATAVGELLDFMLGGERWPQIKVEEAEADDDVSQLAISEADAELLKDSLDEIVEESQLRCAFYELAQRAVAARTGVAIGSIRDGMFSLELPHARDCWPKFTKDDPARPVEGMTWCYRFERMRVEAGLVKYDVAWFRRDYTATEVIHYEPLADEDTRSDAPKWIEKSREQHGFSFCPVVWVRNMPRSHADLDGRSLYDGLLDESDALNLALSQRHRGIHHFGTPQTWETGVGDDDGPGAHGRGASARTEHSAPHGHVADQARKSGPGEIWSYEDPAVRLGLLETTGRAFEVATLHVDDIRARALEMMGVTLLSPKEILGGGELTVSLLRMIYARMIALSDRMRLATWEPALKAVLAMFLRMLADRGADGMHLRRGPTLAKLAKRFEVETTEGTSWRLPKVTLAWGPYFTPSASEKQAETTTALDAKDGGLIASKTATEHVAKSFGVENSDDEHDNAKSEKDEAAALAVKAMQASGPPVPGTPPNPAKQTPPKPPLKG